MSRCQTSVIYAWATLMRIRRPHNRNDSSAATIAAVRVGALWTFLTYQKFHLCLKVAMMKCFVQKKKKTKFFFAFIHAYYWAEIFVLFLVVRFIKMCDAVLPSNTLKSYLQAADSRELFLINAFSVIRTLNQWFPFESVGRIGKIKRLQEKARCI